MDQAAQRPLHLLDRRPGSARSIALSIVICARTANNINHGVGSATDLDSTLTSLTGLYIAQVAIGVLGVLTISSEYSTGMIRATLTAVPQRRAMLAAKGLVFAAATLSRARS